MGEEISYPEDEEEKRANALKSIDQMVQVFGAEKQKRAYSAAKRNLIETEVLETALEPAFAQAKERAATDGYFPLENFFAVVCDDFFFFFLDLMPQDSGLMPPHNPTAESPQDVYDVNDSILKLEVAVLRDTGL